MLGELTEGLIVKPGAHGRRTYSREGKRALVELCKGPGVSVAGIALAHGINANLLRRWIDRYGGESVATAERGTRRRAALLPVQMVEPSPPAAVKTKGAIEISFRSATIRLSGEWTPERSQPYWTAWRNGRDRAAERDSDLAGSWGSGCIEGGLCGRVRVMESFTECGSIEHLVGRDRLEARTSRRYGRG